MAVSDQWVVSPRFPYLPIRVSVRGQELDLEALLDTGFDGHVVVPTDLLGDGDRPDGYLRWKLADGSPVLAPYYLGSLAIGRLGPYPVVVTALGDEGLVGQQVAERVSILLDHGQRVLVGP